MRSAADCQVDCALVQVVLAGTNPGRSASLKAFSVSRCKLHLSNGQSSRVLGPLLEGHPPLQTGVGFASRLRIQSHRPDGWGTRRSKRKCEACRNYKQARGIGPYSGYWDPCSTKLLYSPNISKKWKRSCPHVYPVSPARHPLYDSALGAASVPDDSTFVFGSGLYSIAIRNLKSWNWRAECKRRR
jgi:hypothetical protein